MSDTLAEMFAAKCWADPLSRRERAELARRLARAAHRFWGTRGDAIKWREDPYRAHANAMAEMQDLHLDVTERAAVATT